MTQKASEGIPVHAVSAQRLSLILIAFVLPSVNKV